MHIGFVCNQYPPHPIGGIGARITDLASGLVKNGHRVTVVGVYPRSRGVMREIDELIDGVRVIRLPPPPPWMRWRPGEIWARLSLWLKLKKVHRSDPLDLVESTDGFGWMLFGTPAGVPLVVRVEGSVTCYDAQMGLPRDPFVHWLEKRTFSNADFLTAVSNAAVDDTRAQFKLSPARPVSVIYNAVDTEKFRPADPVSCDRGLIVFANAIEPRKGARELVESINHLAPVYPEARIVLIGADSVINEESYSQTVLKQVLPEYRSRISFLGRMDRMTGVLPMLQRAHVCCYPSYVETFGIAPLEAMAVGRPVVYSKQGPGPELIEDGVSGLLCDPKSPSDIASKINRIFKDPTLAAALGQNGRARTMDLFEKTNWVLRNIEYYRDCVEQMKEAG